MTVRFFLRIELSTAITSIGKAIIPTSTAPGTHMGASRISGELNISTAIPAETIMKTVRRMSSGMHEHQKVAREKHQPAGNPSTHSRAIPRGNRGTRSRQLPHSLRW